MRIILSFVFQWFKKWWALMSCAAFTILSVCEAYSLHPNELAIRGTEGLAVIFALIGFYQIWKEQQDRAIRAERLLKSPPISSKDWEEMAQKMGQACRSIDIECAWTVRTAAIWSVRGGDHAKSCEAWLRRAGAMLVQSPNVKKDVSPKIAAEPDDFVRWCLFLKHRGHFRHSAADVLYTSTAEHFSGYIDEVGVVSSHIFIEFAAKEFRVDG